MKQIIIHVDMDAFYASVEIRDNPALAGKPLIIGSLPQERGVVATASYEARKYGVHSAMNIKEAYRLCPHGVYMHPNFEKYRAVSQRLHEIWDSYADVSETIALDEAYLDVTESAGSWEKACEIARVIKRRTKEELRLTCSVGVAYSKTAAKAASEEKKPDGYFEIPTAEDFVNLIIDRDVAVLYTVGARTAEKLHRAGIRTVRELREQEEEVIRLLGRKMGIYTGRGNPRKIDGIGSLASGTVRMINREKGSGTRILLDQKLKTLGIDRRLIPGYEREYSNHLSIAGAVARGEADFGMGAESAARQVDGVEFIPIQTEWYDLVFPRERREEPTFRLLTEYLTGPEFREEIAATGPYDMSQTGQVFFL